MIRPEFITFTGADDATDIDGMVALSRQYPIEWALLFSPKRQGLENRYPGFDTIKAISDAKGLQLAAHLCGDHARQVLNKGTSQFNAPIAAHMGRVQINTADLVTHDMLCNLRAWAHDVGVGPILQCRDAFPTDPSIQWLFDASGGRGQSPAAWPKPVQPWCGFAGGLNPDNVTEAVAAISALSPTRYWLDMETGVRDDADRFSLAKCRAVCEAVYGAPAGGGSGS